MLSVFFQSLLIAIFTSHVSVAVIYYVKPDYASMSDCPYQHCHDLNYYTNVSLDHHSELHFLSGEFILSSDLTVRDVHNISLIGSKDDNSVANSIIQCNSSSSVIMINITGLNVRNIIIKNCGPVENERRLMNRIRFARFNKLAVVIDYCMFVQFEELTIITNNNPGLLVMNMIENCSMVNVTFNGFISLYNDSTVSGHSVIFEIKNLSFVRDMTKWHKFMLLFKVEVNLYITISNSIFKLFKTLKLIDIAISSFNFQYKIHIKQSNFIDNRIDSIISTVKQQTTHRSHDIIEFSDCIFLNNSMLSDGHLINTDKLKTVSLINCSFHKNSNLKLVAIDYDFFNITIKNTMFSSNIWNFPLINVHNFVLLIFYGPVIFTNNTGDAYLLNITSGVITCYNYIGILHNYVKGFLYSQTRSMINMEENTNLEVKYNSFSNNFAVSQLVADPYPYCLFQYLSKNDYDEMWYQGNYSISFTSNYMKPLPYSYIAGCEWYIFNSAFKTSIPLEVNKHIIIFKNNWPVKSLTSDEKEICFCGTHKLFNCTISNLGPIYPGEALVLQFFITGIVLNIMER